MTQRYRSGPRITATCAVAAATFICFVLPGFATPACATESPKDDARAPGLAAAYLSGRHAEATADGKRAVSFLTQAIEFDPQNQPLLQSTYFLAAQIGNFETAVPAARKAYETAPRRGMAAVILAIDHYKKGEYDRAWYYLEKTPSRSMNAFAMPLLRAWGMAPTQPAEKAIGELGLLKSFQDTGNLVEIVAGMLNEFYGRPHDALAHYSVLAARIESQHISNALAVVDGYARLGKIAQAKTLLARFRAAHGTSPTIDAHLDILTNGQKSPQKMTAIAGMSQALFAAGELLLVNEPNEYRAQVGTAYAQTALYLNPDLHIARRFIGNTLAARGRLDESNAMLATIENSTPGYLEAQMQMADNLARAEKLSGAANVIRGVLKDRAKWSEAYVALGDILRRDKKYKEAISAYDSALKLVPEGNADNWIIYYTRGIALERAKNWRRAEKDFRKALQLRPEEPSVLNYLGYSYLDRGVNLREARKLIEAAYTKRPGDGYIIDSLGWALYMSGEFEKAVAQLEKAAESAPADATINEHLGDAYWRVGRQMEARFQWQRTLTLDLEDSQRTAVNTKLEHGLAQK